jgi:sugar lactone lactonase YvrE
MLGTVAVSGAAALLSAGSAAAQAAAHSVSRAGVILTVAGGVGGPGPATQVAIDFPCSVTSAGRYLYVGDGLVQRVDEATGWLTTPAGGIRRQAVFPEHVPLGDGGPAGEAATSACGTAVDRAGNLILADGLDHLVRVVAAGPGTFYGQAMTAGHIYGIAGTGSGPGITGNGGPADRAVLSDPVSVTADGAGNLVIADAGSSAAGVPAEVQVVAAGSGVFYGRKMAAGDIYAVAGKAAGLAISGDGGPALRAGLGASIGQLARDPAGNIIVADGSANRIRVIAASSGTYYGRKMTGGDIYTVAGTGSAGFSGDGGPATQAQLGGPAGVAADGAGNLVIADTGSNRVRVVAGSSGSFYGHKMTAGDIYTVAGCGTSCKLGDGGPARAGRLIAPDGVAVDRAGNLVVSEHGAGRISSDRRVRAIAARDGTFYGQKMTAGDIYTVVGNGTRGLSGDGGLATKAVMISLSDRMAVDGAGNLVVAAGQNNRIRVVAATTGTFYGIPMTAHHIYAVAGGGKFPYSGDGGPATKAGLNFADGLAIDAHGNLVIADEGNYRIRVVAARTGSFYGIAMTAHHIYTVAGDGIKGFAGDGGPATKAELNVVGGLAVDRAGNVVLADKASNRVRVVAAITGTFYGIQMTAHHIYTVAGDGVKGFSGDGGPAVQAELNSPKDVTVDPHGNLVTVDQDNNRLRVVAARTGTFYGIPMTAGHIYTVAGDGTKGFAGDGGPATKAALSLPTDAIFDQHGNLVIADQGNNRVRVVAAAAGTCYGVPMAAGHIYTVAGNGQPGFSGDGGSATKAMLIAPTGLAVNGHGDLFVGDYYRVRMVTG